MRIKAYWRPTWGGLSWFNISAPDVHIAIGRWSAMIILWELFNRRYADGSHGWGFVLLNIGGRSLLSVTDQGARGLFL